MSHRVEDLLEVRSQLVEMAALPSLAQLQRKGNKKPASKIELRNARKRALKCKTPYEARAKAKEAWQMMEKREIIQVFLDREAQLRNPGNPVPKPLFMDKKRVPWGTLSVQEKKQAAKWIASVKTEPQIQDLIKKAKGLRRRNKTSDSQARVVVYEMAMSEWKRAFRSWKKQASQTNFHFGR